MDRNSREFKEYICGTETYADPSGGTVQLDNTYDHAWALDDGSYILSNDSGFDPGKDLGLSGNKLEKSQYRVRREFAVLSLIIVILNWKSNS